MSAQNAGAADPAAGEVAHAGSLATWEKPLAWIAGALMLFIVGLTFVEVFTRYVFSMPIRGASEMIQFAMALMIFSALPLTTGRRGHITVSLIDGLLGAASRRVVGAVIDTVSLATVSLIAWRLFVHAGGLAESAEATIVLQAPTAPLSYAMSALAAITALVQARLLMSHFATRAPGAMPQVRDATRPAAKGPDENRDV